MARDGWLEQRTRIPFAGIIAMVLVVALVAVFLRSSLDQVLPRAEVGVTATGSESANAHGSASFRGEREIPLAYKERLQGMLTHGTGTTRFILDVPSRVLVIEEQGRSEEILLSLTDDGIGLAASFEYAGSPATIVAFPAERELRFQREGQQTVSLMLADTVSYEGFFLFAGEQYFFSYLPSSSEARIEGSELWSVLLTDVGDVAVGTWRRDGTGHPVQIDLSRMHAVIGELW